jgi:choline dehydrogenase-like flavoprotein
MPGNLKGAALENFIRDAASTYWHQTCTAKMGRDSMSVADGDLKVYGIENLRVADGSIMPRVTTGNTMAPCVIIGERAAEVIRIRLLPKANQRSERAVGTANTATGTKKGGLSIPGVYYH